MGFENNFENFPVLHLFIYNLYKYKYFAKKHLYKNYKYCIMHIIHVLCMVSRLLSPNNIESLTIYIIYNIIH